MDRPKSPTTPDFHTQPHTPQAGSRPDEILCRPTPPTGGTSFLSVIHVATSLAAAKPPPNPSPLHHALSAARAHAGPPRHAQMTRVRETQLRSCTKSRNVVFFSCSFPRTTGLFKHAPINSTPFRSSRSGVGSARCSDRSCAAAAPVGPVQGSQGRKGREVQPDAGRG